MAILDPVKVVVINPSSAEAAEVQVPNIPHLPDKGVHSVPFDPCELYIDRSDLREVHSFYSLTKIVQPSIEQVGSICGVTQILEALFGVLDCLLDLPTVLILSA